MAVASGTNVMSASLPRRISSSVRFVNAPIARTVAPAATLAASRSSAAPGRDSTGVTGVGQYRSSPQVGT